MEIVILSYDRGRGLMAKKEGLIERLGIVIIVFGLMIFAITIFVGILTPFSVNSFENDFNAKVFRFLLLLSISDWIIGSGLLLYFFSRMDRKLS